jgi:hypothetical protein
MTHDELLAKIEKQTVHIANKIRPVADKCEKEIGGFANALRSVVELHKRDVRGNCDICTYITNGGLVAYPCFTIQAIEKELG